MAGKFGQIQGESEILEKHVVENSGVVGNSEKALIIQKNVTCEK